MTPVCRVYGTPLKILEKIWVFLKKHNSKKYFYNFFFLLSPDLFCFCIIFWFKTSKFDRCTPYSWTISNLGSDHVKIDPFFTNTTFHFKFCRTYFQNQYVKLLREKKKKRLAHWLFIKYIPIPFPFFTEQQFYIQ